MEATQAGRTRALAINSDVYFRDRCHSTEGARLQATLKDSTQLTLGENATVVVDEFIYDPVTARGELSIRVVKGAFLYVGGRIEGVNGAKVEIHTPAGAIGLRGTTVWGGPIDNGYGVIVLSGEVTVTGRRGTVTLKQGQGTMLFGDGKLPWEPAAFRAAERHYWGSMWGRWGIRHARGRRYAVYLIDGPRLTEFDSLACGIIPLTQVIKL